MIPECSSIIGSEAVKERVAFDDGALVDEGSLRSCVSWFNMSARTSGIMSAHRRPSSIHHSVKCRANAGIIYISVFTVRR